MRPKPTINDNKTAITIPIAAILFLMKAKRVVLFSTLLLLCGLFLFLSQKPPITKSPSHADALLLHGYWLSQKGNGTVGLSLRSQLEVQAAYLLYKEHKVDYLVITGGPIWGNKYPSMGAVMQQQLLLAGVPSDKIVLVDTAMDTYEEIAVFLSLAKTHHWHKLADLAAFQHDKTIPALFATQHKTASYLTVENTLQAYGTTEERQESQQLTTSIYNSGLGLYEDFVRLILLIDPNYQLLGLQAHRTRNHKTPYGGIFFLPVDKYAL